jgi:hypothetical protein
MYVHFRHTFRLDFLLLFSGFVHTGAIIPLLMATVSDAMVGVGASRFLPRGGPGPAAGD